MWLYLESSLEILQGLGKERTGAGFAASPKKIVRGLVPELTLERVVSKPFDMLRQTRRVQALDRIDNHAMECAGAGLEHAAVRHVVGEGVLGRLENEPPLRAGLGPDQRAGDGALVLAGLP